MKTKFLLYTFAALFLSSCAAHFNRYPGEKVASFPESMQGDYYIASKPAFFYWFKKDTASIRITSNGIFAVSGLNSASDPLLLSDSVVLSRLGKYYALSQRDENIPGAWTTSVMKHDKGSIQLYIVEENKPYSRNLHNLFSSVSWVRKPTGEWTEVQLNMDAKQRAMKNSHSDTAVVFQVKDEAYINLFERFVSKEKALVLKRIK